MKKMKLLGQAGGISQTTPLLSCESKKGGWHMERNPAPKTIQSREKPWSSGAWIDTLIFGFLFLFVFPLKADAREKIGIGLPAPNFTLESTTGAKVMLSDFKGKVVLLDFWATWCPPCRFSIPALTKLHEKYKNKNFAILGINLDEYRKPVLSFVKKQKIEYWVLYGGKEQVGFDFRIRAIPSFFLLDTSGKIVKIYSGFYPGLEKEWEEEIDRLLLGKDASKDDHQ